MSKEPFTPREPHTLPREEPRHTKAKPRDDLPPPDYTGPKWDFMVTAGFDSLNAMGGMGWEYLEMWDAPTTVTSHGPIHRIGIEPFFIWRRPAA
jgi:hypothetical protein